jgi:hypothetical protein
MTTGAEQGLTGPWLAARLGVDPVRLDMLRRSVELVALRPDGSDDWIYPAWQFDEEFVVRPEVRTVLEAARAAGVPGERLTELFGRRIGLSGGRTALDALRAGDPQPLLVAVRGDRSHRPHT